MSIIPNNLLLVRLYDQLLILTFLGLEWDLGKV